MYQDVRIKELKEPGIDCQISTVEYRLGWIERAFDLSKGFKD